MIATVKGEFKKFEADVYTVGLNFLTADINLWIDTESVDTGDAKRDQHLKSADFFDVAVYKEISFTSHGIEKADKDGNHELWGVLTIKGISKKIKLDVAFGGVIRDPWGNDRAGFNVVGKINRKDWGLIWNTEVGNGGVMLGDEVKIECDIQLVKPAEGHAVMTAEKEEEEHHEKEEDKLLQLE